MTWTPISRAALGSTTRMLEVDANFIWACATSFRDFKRPDETLPPALPFILELDAQGGIAALKRELTRFGAGGSVPRIFSKARPSNGAVYCTALLPVAYVEALIAGKPPLRGGPEIGRMVRRFELQMPVIPEQPRPKLNAAPAGRVAGYKRAVAGKTLIGVIDSGCAFAHQRLRSADGEGTRLLNIWDQDGQPAFTRVPHRGSQPDDLAYGCEASRVMLDKIMQASRQSGVINEDACYELAGYPALRRRFSHGTAVMDLLAGSVPLRSRLAHDPDTAPTWARASDVASKADLVFVQLPRDAVQDSSSAGLPRLLLDGMRYILSCAGDLTETIVINISDGSSRGSHDGESIIEKAMLALVEEQRGLGRELKIVVAAGNSFDEERHAQFDDMRAGVPQTVRLRLPPGGNAPSYVSIVLPPGASDVAVRLVPPGQVLADQVLPGNAFARLSRNEATSAVVYPAPNGSPLRHRVLLAFAPTASFNGATPLAQSGDWRVELCSAEGLGEAVHLYIPRNQTNPGALHRSLQARFIDESGLYDPERHLRHAEDDPPHGPFSPIRRRGSLSSLATVPVGKGVWVAASYLWREKTPSEYSSAGTALGQAAGARVGPDFALPTDFSRAVPGICCAGGRSGEAVGAKGTSFAAPLLARRLLEVALAPLPEHNVIPIQPGSEDASGQRADAVLDP